MGAKEPTPLPRSKEEKEMNRQKPYSPAPPEKKEKKND